MNPAASNVLPDDCFLHDRDRLRHDEALALIDERVRCMTRVEEGEVPLDAMVGRVTAEAFLAPRSVPAHDNAAVDGYAYAHADGPKWRSVTLRVAAGDAPPPLPPKSAARIFTGAPMPQGADTVAMQEDCVREGERVRVPDLRVGANCRREGEDVAAGSPILSAGERVTTRDIAALAASGLAASRMRERVRVAIMSNGSELLAPGAPFRPAGVYDSNRPMLASILASFGCEVSVLPTLPDDEPAIRTALAGAARENHLVVTSAGASRGEEDHVLGALDALGRRHLWQLAVKPGRPMMMGQIGDCVVVGLPGNPVAAFVCALLYLRPIVGRLSGAPFAEPARFPLPAGFSLTSKPDRREFLRGRLKRESDEVSVEKFARDGSGLISSLRWAEGLIEVAEETTRIERGDPVAFIPFSEFLFSI